MNSHIKSRAQQAFDRIRDGQFEGAARCLAGSNNQSKIDTAKAALIIAANLTADEQETLRDWLDTQVPA